jgi:hypothetical protein
MEHTQISRRITGMRGRQFEPFGISVYNLVKVKFEAPSQLKVVKICLRQVCLICPSSACNNSITA